MIPPLSLISSIASLLARHFGVPTSEKFPDWSSSTPILIVSLSEPPPPPPPEQPASAAPTPAAPVARTERREMRLSLIVHPPCFGRYCVHTQLGQPHCSPSVLSCRHHR